MIFVDTNVFYNILFDTELTQKAKQAVSLLDNPVTSFIAYNELIHVTLRAYARRKFGITSYQKYKKFFVKEGIEAFREPIEWVHRILDELGVEVLRDHQSLNDLRNMIEQYRLLPTDAQIALTCKYYGITTIATLDSDFKRVPWLKTIP